MEIFSLTNRQVEPARKFISAYNLIFLHFSNGTKSQITPHNIQSDKSNQPFFELFYVIVESWGELSDI